jgi:hypothetical protein
LIHCLVPKFLLGKQAISTADSDEENDLQNLVLPDTLQAISLKEKKELLKFKKSHTEVCDWVDLISL